MPIVVIKPDRDDVKRLIHEADASMLAAYPAESNHLDDIGELSRSNVYFLGAFVKDQLAAIGAVKTMNDDGIYGEIKRLYVDPLYRGQNLSVKLMQRLERHLITNGIALARLETGEKQTAAISLYEKLGYYTRHPYGKYVTDPFSIFMEKRLSH
jgi:putative acetyltransferase